MMKFVAVEDPTTNWLEAWPAIGFIANCAQGVVEAIPRLPAIELIPVPLIVRAPDEVSAPALHTPLAIVPSEVMLACTADGRVEEIEGTPPEEVMRVPLFPVTIEESVSAAVV
jgi:hypothetical protein